MGLPTHLFLNILNDTAIRDDLPKNWASLGTISREEKDSFASLSYYILP